MLSSVLGKCHSVTPSIFVCFMPFQVFPYYITIFSSDNRTHYTICQSTVQYDTQLTNDSLTTLIVFRSRNYTDSFFSYVHLFSDIPSSDNVFLYALASLLIE